MDYDLFFSSSSDEDEKRSLTVQRRLLRQTADIFALPESKFVSYFRLSKPAFQYVLEEIRPKLTIRKRSLAISPDIKLATTLRFLAQGSYQVSVGNDFNIALSQSAVSRVLTETINAMATTICGIWIVADMTNEEKLEAKQHFFNKTGFPGVIGCVDGTHIKIITPPGRFKNQYYNRKGFSSLNVMLVCDHRMRIRFVDARFAGSAHDSLVWNVSSIRRVLQERYDAGERNSWLLGDAGYPLEQFLMTPYRSAQGGSPECLYNTKHAQTRNIVERVIGVLKGRFRCLLAARELHYKPPKATQIVNVCPALHNICVHYHTDIEENYDYIIQQERLYNDDAGASNEDSTEAVQIRDSIKNSFIL